MPERHPTAPYRATGCIRTRQMKALSHMQDLEGEGPREVGQGACEVDVEATVDLVTNMGTHCHHRALLAQRQYLYRGIPPAQACRINIQMKAWAASVAEAEGLIPQEDTDVAGHMGTGEVDLTATAEVHRWVWLLVLVPVLV